MFEYQTCGIGVVFQALEEADIPFLADRAVPHDGNGPRHRALAVKDAHPERWQNLRIRAASMRFDWASAARQTVSRLYEPGD